jgi:hypothetical protein
MIHMHIELDTMRKRLISTETHVRKAFSTLRVLKEIPEAASTLLP